MASRFEKLTPFNGFDKDDPDNARQNNYAWSMAEMGDYLYVGTGRNIVYGVFKSGILGNLGVPDAFTPQNLDMNGEIWRVKKNGSKIWERVYKAPPESGIIGFRYLILYTAPSGETALYAGCATARPGVLILKSTDGEKWVPLPTGINLGSSTRSMIVHENKLYMVVLPGKETEVSDPLLYTSADPEKDGWEQVNLRGTPGKNPRGNGLSMLSFNGHLYMGTAMPGGFEVWRTRGTVPKQDDWVMVVDKGAGDALNEVPVDFSVFKGYIYVGTAVYLGILSLDPQRKFVPPKGFDLIRIGPDDNWELVIGNSPVLPTEPTTGSRGKSLSGYPAGFGDISNGYCWQVQAQGNELYLGTWDWSDLIYPILSLFNNRFSCGVENYQEVLLNYLKFVLDADSHLSPLPRGRSSRRIFSLLGTIIGDLVKREEETFGFDLWKSQDGVHWTPVSINGLGNPHNYGVRNLFLSSNGNLYLGTANPFEGCEVWVQKPKLWLDY